MKLLPLVVAAALLGGGFVRSSEPFDETGVVTLFAFDDQSIPHSRNLRLEMRQPQRHPANPVLRRGEAGSVDAMGVQFYGSVIREADRFRMWYVAFDDDTASKAPSARWRAAYAESTDGVTWTKPDLGLVEFRGNRSNNLLDMGGAWGFVNLKVICDDTDPDPARRYKMTTHVYFRHNTRLGTLLPFTSPDGLTWKPVKDVKPVKGEMRKEDLLLPIVHLEPASGLYQRDGWYYLTAQNAMPGILHYQGRVVRIYRSSDFVNWKPDNHIGFVRDTQHEWLGEGRSREGEQNHEGIAVWDRKNVLLGAYGRWHGAAEWKDITVDLGFVVSNNGLDFREPLHEWTFLPRGEDGAWDQGGILQGQGFENVGDETFIYYGAWDPRNTGGTPQPRGGVGIASLPRDRFGTLMEDESGKGPGDYQAPETTCELVTASFAPTEKIFLNAEGLGPESRLVIEMLDERERPLRGRVAKIQSNGFQVPVIWQDPDKTATPEKVCFRLRFEGSDRAAIRFYALYLF